MMNNKEYVVLTGASGFIGKHMLKALQHVGLFVIAISRNVGNYHNSTTPGLKWCDWESIDSAVDEMPIDAVMVGVIHLATEYGRNTSSLMEVEDGNVVKPLKLLDLAVKKQASIFLNTDSFFAKEAFDYQYMRPYIMTKRHFNEIGQHYSEKYNIVFANLRLEHVFGPGDNDSKFIPQIISNLCDGQLDIHCTSGLQVRDFIYVEDVISAYLTVLNKVNELPSYIEYQVGTGRGVSLKEFLLYLHEMIPGSPGSFKFGALEQRKNEIMKSVANNEGLILLGWQPKYDYKSGIREMLNAYSFVCAEKKS